MNTDKYTPPQIINTSCNRFKLPNYDIVLPTDTTYSKLNDNSQLTNTDKIEGKLLIHSHTDLLCFVARILTDNNKPLVRLYYSTRNGQRTIYIIPPLLAVATTNRLLKFHEDHAKSTLILITHQYVLTHYFGTGGVQLKLHCLPSLFEYMTHKWILYRRPCHRICIGFENRYHQ